MRVRDLAGNRDERLGDPCEPRAEPAHLTGMERDSERIAREWTREIEADIDRLAARRDEGWGRVVVWTLLEVVWIFGVFAVLGLFSRLN